MAVNPTVGFVKCKECPHTVAVKKTGEGHHSAVCDGCGFRHYWPAGTPSHRKVAGEMTPHTDPFAPAPIAEPAPAPAKPAAKPAPAKASPYGIAV